MNIGTRQHLATATALATIGLIAAAIWWAYAEVEDASRQRRQTTEITRGLTDLRLVTFEYVVNRRERARAQWHAVSDRINRLLANIHFVEPEQKEILAGLRERSAAAPRLFGEFTSAPAGDRVDAAGGESSRRFEAQLFSWILIQHEDSLADAFRLTDLAIERINDAQRRVMIVILAGLVLIAAITASASWLLNRAVLAPIVRLQHGTSEVAAGNWNFKLGIRGDDEIGELSKNFDAMTRSLRTSFTQVERSNQELAALNKELEAFSYSVSHDLRGPLRSMDGFSLVLLEDYGDKLDEEGKDALARIRAASQRMGALIDDLLRLSQVTRAELKLKRVDLSGIAQAVAASLQGDRSGRTVEWALEEGMTLTADTELMRILMQNLLQNAWKFTGKTKKPTIRVGTLERDREKVCFVADNGVGFDMAYADRLFGAFQRLHHAADFPGTGIGLAIAQRIVHRHEGKIWAEAKEGEGATFFFTIGDLGNDASRQQDHLAG